MFEVFTTSTVRSISGALWALNTDLAYRRHFPAIDWVQSFSLYAERLHAWFGREVGEEWITLREEAMRLLQKERELQDIVQLVGLDAVQDQERIVIESARLVREGFLRQSAIHEVDASCPPQKALLMLRLLLHYSRRASQALGAGASLKSVLGAGLEERLLRLGEVKPGDMEAAGGALLAQVDETLKGLEAS